MHFEYFEWPTAPPWLALDKKITSLMMASRCELHCAMAESTCSYSATRIQVYGSGKSMRPWSQWAATLCVSAIMYSHRQPKQITLGTKRSSPDAFAGVSTVENRSGRPTKRSIWRQETTHNLFLVLHPGCLTAHPIHSGFQTR